MAKIVLVSTSHIARESMKKVKSAVEKENPDCIAVELDRNRYHAMKVEQSVSHLDMLKQLGFTTWLIFALFRRIQKSLGKKVNIFPGAEMLGAVKIASKKHVKVAFIDQDIRRTFLKIKEIGALEKLKLVWFVLKGLVIGWIYQKIRRKSLVDLNKVPKEELVEQAMSHLRKNFPNIYKVLVFDRDKHMTKNLKALSKEFDTIVAVIGAGHKKGMEKLLKTSRKHRSPQGH